MKSAVRITLALASVALIVPALAGCAIIEGAISDATGGAVNVSVGNLPEGWPEEVPVADGDIVVGGVAETDAGLPLYNATINISSGGFPEIKAQLEEAGFTQVDGGQPSSGDVASSGAFVNDTWGVFVAVTGTTDAYVANYTVAAGDPPTQ